MTTIDPSAGPPNPPPAPTRSANERLPSDAAKPAVAPLTFSSPEVVAAREFAIDLAAERRTEKMDPVAAFDVGMDGPKENLIPSTSEILAAEQWPESHGSRLDAWREKALAIARQVLATVRRAIAAARETAAPAIAKAWTRVATSKAGQKVGDAAGFLKERALRIGPVAKANAWWGERPPVVRKATYWGLGGALVLLLLLATRHPAEPAEIAVAQQLGKPAAATQTPSVASVFSQDSKSESKADTARPTQADFVRLYPYGAKGQKGPHGEHAPPPSQVRFDFEEELACPDGTSSRCWKVAFTAPDGFSGAMYLTRDANSRWVRVTDDGLPFPPGHPSKKSAKKKKHR